MKKYLISGMVFTLVILSGLTISSAFETNQFSFSLQSLPSHDPIHIVNNGEFTAENGVTDGSGTKEDPYIVEGWDIFADIPQDGIRIDDTDKHFIIRNCFIHFIDGAIAIRKNDKSNIMYPLREETKPYPMGIFFNNVTNGTVINCIIDGTIQQICVNNSKHIMITNCEGSRNICGIGILTTSHDNIVINCSSRNYGCGVCIYENSWNNTIDNCTHTMIHSPFDEPQWFGFMILNSEGNKVLNSRCFSNYPSSGFFNDRGVAVYKAKNNQIFNCNFYGLSRGIEIRGSDATFIHECQFTNNRFGVYIKRDSYNNVLEDNIFINNKLNAWDFSTENRWNANYWDDWIGLNLNFFTNFRYHIPGRLFYNFDVNPKLFP